MFIMNKDEVRAEVEKINNYIAKCMWMDFEFCRMNGYQVVMAGSIDQSYNEYAIKIDFEQPHFVSSLFSWHADTSKPFIHLLTNKEETEAAKKYGVEMGNYIFKVNTEGFEKTPILISAKKITCVIIKETPFSLNRHSLE